MKGYPYQTTLLEVGPLLRPAPRGAFHYVPVVKTLPGELKALAHASPSAWRRITPLVEIATKRGDNEVTQAPSVLAHIGDELRAVFGVDRTFFVDLRWVKYGLQVQLKGGFKRRAVEHVLQECQASALRCIPVVAPGQDSRVVQLLRDAFGFRTRGVCIRVPIAGVVRSGTQALRVELDTFLDQLEVDRGATDLFLDLGYMGAAIPPSAKDVLATLQGIDPRDWRTLVLAGTVVPDTLAMIEEETIGELTRHDWLIWKELERLGPARLPCYGDYMIQHPTPPLEGGRGMRANVRYTTDDRFLFARGTTPKGGNYGQYQRLCQDLKGHREFRDANSSWGERMIDECARGIILPKAPYEWRAIGTSQHLEHVVRLLDRLEAA